MAAVGFWATSRRRVFVRDLVPTAAAAVFVNYHPRWRIADAINEIYAPQVVADTAH
jgi:hypothetical protein